MIHRILNTGISDENQENLNNGIKLNNFIALFILAISVISAPLYIYLQLPVLVILAVAIILIAVFSIYLQSLKKHLLSFCILIFSMILLLNFVSFYLGLVVNMHFFFICTCMTSLVLFEKNKFLRNIILGISISSFFVISIWLTNKEGGLIQFSTTINAGLEIYGYFNYFILFLFTIIFFSTFLKQKVLFQEELVNQNVILEHKNSQITDSIKYAKHIQNAILPPLNIIKNYLKDSFILYKPKDIVAGDFYWFEAQEDGSMLFAAADSTGHGVPGAMVSVVCTNALNRAVKEFGLKDPGLILDKVRELIVDSFQKSGEDLSRSVGVKDGMDISLCLIDPTKRMLKWAGANNPLWIIQNNADDVMVIKPDKQSVAKTESPLPFTTKTVQLEMGDCFYLFTDGYADQFGGESSKKFMQKRLKELLLRIYKKPMELQKKLVHDNLLTWMGNLEQVDDICFVGVKL